MGEVFCVARGDVKKLTEWVVAKDDRYVVWVDADAEVDHPRIFVTGDNDLSFQQIAKDLLYVPFIFDDSDHPALQKLARIQSELHYRASDFADQGVKLLDNYRGNLQRPTKIAEECFGKFSQFPAIICDAGPSLKEVIPFLKEHRDHFLIIGCGAGMQALLAEGIEPHLAIHIDLDPNYKFPKTTIPFFYQLRTSQDVASKMKGDHFLMAGAGKFPLERWIEEKLGLSHPSESGWSSTTRGAELAHSLGCHAFYFAGVDFSPCILDAEWLSRWAQDKNCALLSKPNPLIPSIPAADLSILSGHAGVTAFAKATFNTSKEKTGQAMWNEIAVSFASCQKLVVEFLSHFQSIYPNSPLQDPMCLSILEKINQQLATLLILDPIWAHWEAVLGRDVKHDPNALTIHRILLLKNLADRFHAR